MSAPLLFDRRLLARRRLRAAETLAEADFLHREAAAGIADRVATTKRRFPLAVDLGASGGRAGAALGATGKTDLVISTETTPALAARLAAPRLVCDEEALPFAPASLDLVVSGLALQWVNDLPGTLVQIGRALRPDGFMVAAVLGGRSLSELRSVLIDAELSVAGGVRPRVAPFLDVREGGALLQRAGFALPVADSDILTVRYGDPIGLLKDMRALGWANALGERSRAPLRRDVLARALALYGERHADPDGRVRATFEIVYLSGWAPHDSQRKPLAPGSAARGSPMRRAWQGA